MEGRVISLKGEEGYIRLMKLHLLQDPKHCSNWWKSSDLDFVCGNFADFLVGVAGTGCSINRNMFAKCLMKHFVSSQQECKEFAAKLAMCLAFCRERGRPGRMTSGKKTSDGVMRVVRALLAKKQEDSSEADPGSAYESPVVVEVPATPPRQGDACAHGGGALGALRKLQEAFGTEATTASMPTMLGSPVSIASSSCAGSPVAKMSPVSFSSLFGDEGLTKKVPGPYGFCCLHV